MSRGQEIAMHGHNLEIVSTELLAGSGGSPAAKRIWCILTPVGGHWWKDSRNFVVDLCATFKPDKSWGHCPMHLVTRPCYPYSSRASVGMHLK